jgi:hypothetical protein
MTPGILKRVDLLGGKPTTLASATQGNVVEALPLSGGPSVELFRSQPNQLIFDVIELRDGSILMSMVPPGSGQISTPEVEIWKLRTDQVRVAGQTPRRLTWAGAAGAHLSASTMGDRVVFLTTEFQRDLYMAGADLQRGVLDSPRRFTLTDHDDGVFAWAPDGSAVFVESNRTGTTDVFKQDVNSDIAEPVLTGPRSQGSPAVTTDGRWLLYADGTYTDKTIMRLPLTGGVPAELVHVGRAARPRCAVRGPAGSENSDHTFSGNSDHLPVALPGQKIAGDSASGEGKDDRHAQTARDSGASAGGAHLGAGGGVGRRVSRDGAAGGRGRPRHDGR